MNIQAIHWAQPALIPLVLAMVVAATILHIYRLRKITQAVALLVTPEHRALLLHYAYGKKVLKALAFCAGIFFLGVALLRPQWDELSSSVEQQGRDLLIALDISRSMLAQDLVPDRLSFAKTKIKELVKQLKTERVGLMLFAGTTFLQCPLTEDIGAFTMFLDAIDADTISSGTTAIDEAIREALTVFEKMPERKSKLLAVFTDGEDFSSNLATIKRKAAEVGLHIVTVGVGTQEGAPIPLYDRHNKQCGHQLDAKNNVVISRLNEGILQRISEDTGGLFVKIASDDSDIKRIQQFITSFETERLHDKQIKRYQEQYQWPLLASLFCLAFEWIL